VAFFEVPKPRVLALRELPGVSFDEFDGLVKRVLALQVLDNFPVTDRLQGSRTERSILLKNLARFVDEASGEHAINTSINPLVEPFAGGAEPVHMLRSLRFRQRWMKLEFRHGPAPDFNDF
jgi:hypothetical protein